MGFGLISPRGFDLISPRGFGCYVRLLRYHRRELQSEANEDQQGNSIMLFQEEVINPKLSNGARKNENSIRKRQAVFSLA